MEVRKTFTIPNLKYYSDLERFVLGKPSEDEGENEKGPSTVTFPICDIREFSTWYDDTLKTYIGLVDCNPQPKEHVWGRMYYFTKEMIEGQLVGTDYEDAFKNFDEQYPRKPVDEKPADEKPAFGWDAVKKFVKEL